MIDRVSAWAGELLGSDALILDSETTGLGSGAEIIELAVIDMAGEVIFARRARVQAPGPVGSIDPGAGRVHGIRLEDLAAAPTLPDLYADLVGVLTGRRVVIYNAAFDVRLLAGGLLGACRAWGLVEIPMVAECAMKQYSAYCWSKRWVVRRWVVPPPAFSGMSWIQDMAKTL